MEPKQKNGKHEQIMSAAIRVFAEKGYFQSTIAQIARAAGVADGTIYLYFKNKEDIMAQFVNQQSKKFFDTFTSMFEGKQSAIERLKALIRLHFQVSQEDRYVALVYQVEMRRSDRLMKEDIKDALRMYHDLVGQIVEEGQQEGAIRHDVQIGLVKRMIFATVDEVITSWVMAGGKYDLEPLAEPLANLLLQGIQATPTA
ncbi:transcriptional regulator, TetR family [Desulfatibacillum alkenivorans DSM 16219]|uniref:Transcriptional regulator, TetR family n=1 Tax=Desulfatibacillum alkenivorans DSM 16219 TaxID=1121393 RepID=A0A1M6R5K0_9BACT|nr:TetR/AcrR family transcriptional regulator [Desulfatibacillum alkenivorans]SHK27734.1 transcriptional regulator, TetR family [Desulfatibacillum alkenivorans DSM 16219]